MKILPVFILLAVFAANNFAQNCLEKAKIVAPVLTENARKTYESKLSEAKTDFAKTPNADSWIWLGRRTAYLGNYKDAIKIFTDGIAKFPKDARFYRHRGHRLISIRCFDDAVKDFETAESLVKGKPDEIEPDGLPNAKNLPTSTLHTNISYHLGLAHYLKGDFNQSAGYFMQCFNQSKNDDMRVAAAHWAYMSARRFALKEKKSEVKKDAQDFITEEIKNNLNIIENDDYYTLVKLYQGKTKPEDLLKEIGAETDSLSNASLDYGLGNWFLYNGEREKAETIWRKIVSGNQWASFGFIAAEIELKN